MAKPPQAVNRGDLGWLTTSPMVILLVMMLAMGTHIPQPVIRILGWRFHYSPLRGRTDLPAQRSFGMIFAFRHRICFGETQ